ncbi:MAG: MqnA/MqnD/SBP family protein [Saprospiraceae bacterium]
MKLTFAFSPCPNDTFMFEPIVNNRIDTEGLEFEIVLQDVETLNKAAFDHKHDITKLSFNAFTQMTNWYQLLNSGSALGSNCGPLLVATKPLTKQEIEKAIIGIPGKNTTANFLLSFAYPSVKNKKELVFSEIEAQILNGEIDAGVIIHENRFTYQDKGLIKIKDLGEYWENKTKTPIPLGGIVVSRAFNEGLKSKIDRVVQRSVAYAIAHPESGWDYITCNAQEMDKNVMKSHINLYVNQYSANIGNEGRASIDYLFEHHPNVNNSNITKPLFVPKENKRLTPEYWSSRYKEEQTGWDVGTITTPLKAYVDQLKDKSIKILIPGAGNSHEAEYLHGKGFTNVYVCDISQEPLVNLKNRCPSFPSEHLIKGDFFELEGQFDLILEQTFFCALNPNLRKKYADKMYRILNANGKLAGLLFDFQFDKQGPPFGGCQEDYEKLFTNKNFVIQLMEPSYNSIQPRAGMEIFFILKKGK